MTKFAVHFERIGDGVGDGSAEQFPVALAQTMDGDLHRALAHRELRAEFSIGRSLAVTSG